MKIAFLVTRTDKPSARYRVLQFIPLLSRNGYRSDVIIIPSNFWDRLKIFRNMKNYDIVFLQKKLLSFFDWSILRKYSKKILYDFDDAVMFSDSNKGNFKSRKRARYFKRVARNADMVICGNNYLKSFSLNENPRTYVIPTSIDMNRYTEKPSSYRSSDAIILGWIGSSATLFYLERMKNVWDTIFELFPNTQLKIVADRFFECTKMPVIKKRWEYKEEVDDLLTFDIGLMPLTDDPWSRGKCGFKLLQYMAVGIPAVCSPVGFNKEIVSDGINGFFAESERSWIEKISMLIQNQGLRYEVGKKARAEVRDKFSVQVNGTKLIELLSMLNEKANEHSKTI